MPPRPHRPDALAGQVFRGSDAVRQGLLTHHQLRGRSWVRVMHDVYADARLARDHGLVCRAALLKLPAEAVLAGPSAAYLHGVAHAAAFSDDVHVLVPRAIRIDSPRGIRVHSAGPATPGTDPTGAPPGAHVPTGAPPDAHVPGGAPPGAHVPGGAPPGRVRRSDPTAAAWECAVWLDPVRAVGIVDALLAKGLTSRAALADLAAANLARPGGRRAGWLFGLADAAAQSPPESHLRMRLVLAGLPRPVARFPVRLPTGPFQPGLAWPGYRVAVEYDGPWRRDLDLPRRPRPGPDRPHVPRPDPLSRPRLDRFVAAGWLVLHVTDRRMAEDFPGVVREVRAALRARGWRR